MKPYMAIKSVNREKFLHIIQNQVLINDDDILSLQKEAKNNPYSQIIHTLLAKHHHQAKSPNANSSLQLAAIYATDRVVLKGIVTSTPIKKVNHQTKEAPKFTEKKAKTFTSLSSGVSDIDQLRNDIFDHLDQLQESKNTYLTQNGAVPESNSEVSAFPEEKTITKKEKTTAKKEKTTAKKKKSVEKKQKSGKKKSADKTEKERISLSQKEQVDLIEKFIQSPPAITRGKDKATSKTIQQDLSEIKANIEEDFASENLAQILTKQGNKEKAIEIYKKLIWKFPQKKAYFAAQIEGLKK